MVFKNNYVKHESNLNSFMSTEILFPTNAIFILNT